MQGITGMNGKGAAHDLGKQALQAPDPMNGPGSTGGELNITKDTKDASTETKFGDLWKNIQTKYGAKPDKPREIKKQLGKDDFLKIMITQMKNQDPTNPFKAEEMATQMAQFASVEQLQNLNTNVSKMANGGQPMERLAMTNLIGKTVTVDRERFVHNDNETSSLGFGLSREAKNVKIQVISESGETILEKDLGPMAKGDQTFVWDGSKTNGMPTKPGNFIFKINAVDAGDRPIAMDSKAQAKVVGVSFEGQEGALLVGDANSPQKITMRNVIRIDSDTPAGIPGARSMASALQSQGIQQAEEPKSGVNGNYFAFEKGVGSKPLDGSQAEARKALEAYEAAKNTSGKISANENSEKPAEKGFPNGFSSGDNE